MDAVIPTPSPAPSPSSALAPAATARPSPRRDARVRPLESFGTVFRWSLRRALAAKRFRWAAALTIGLGLLAGFAGGGTDPAFHLWHRLDKLLIGSAIPLLALGLAGRGFSEEVSEQTLVYLLVRPVSRATVFFARFVAGVVPAVAGATLMLLAATLSAKTRLPLRAHVEIAGIAALGAVTVGAVYYALAALFRRGLVAGLVYTFVIEGFFQFLPGTAQDLSLMHHVRSLFHAAVDSDFAERSRRVADALGPAARRGPRDASEVLLARAREEWSTPTTALLVCGIAAVFALVAGVRAVKARDYPLKDS